MPPARPRRPGTPVSVRVGGFYRLPTPEEVASMRKRRARLNCISHLLSQVQYEDLTSTPLVLPPRQADDYVRPPETELTTVPVVY